MCLFTNTINYGFFFFMTFNFTTRLHNICLWSVYIIPLNAQKKYIHSFRIVEIMDRENLSLTFGKELENECDDVYLW